MSVSLRFGTSFLYELSKRQTPWSNLAKEIRRLLRVFKLLLAIVMGIWVLRQVRKPSGWLGRRNARPMNRDSCLDDRPGDCNTRRCRKAPQSWGSAVAPGRLWGSSRPWCLRARLLDWTTRPPVSPSSRGAVAVSPFANFSNTAIMYRYGLLRARYRTPPPLA